jgi:MFS family permease
MNSIRFSDIKNLQYYKFSAYGFLKNLRFFDAFFILFLIEKGLSFSEIGILYAIREIAINVLEVPSGIVADTFGRKSSLIASFFAYILSFIIFYLSGDFWLFLIAFLFYGVGDAFRSGTHKGMIMDYLKLNNWQEQKINYYGHTRAWSQKGSALSSIIAGIIVFYDGSYQSVFLYSVIPYVLNIILIFTYPGQLNKSAIPSVQNVRQGVWQTYRDFIKTTRQIKVLRIINSSAVHTAYLKAIKDYIQPVMVHVIIFIPVLMSIEQDKKNGLFVGLMYFVIYLLTSFASMFADKAATRHKKNISYFSLLIGLIAGILSGILYNNSLWVMSLIAFTVVFIIENIRKPILTGFVADHVPNEILTSVISAQSLLKTIIAAILAIIFGVVADHYGIGWSLVVVSGGLILVSVVLQNVKLSSRVDK